MSLVKSISGIRGTIGGRVGEGLNPLDIVRFTAAYATQRMRQIGEGKKLKIVVGRDARVSGMMVEHLVTGTLLGMGCDVVNIGLATTPTTELAVIGEQAAGGIILTASHNPKQWNALKLLNNRGMFLTDAEGKEVLSIAEKEDFCFAEVEALGTLVNKDYLPYHIDNVLSLPLVDKAAIEQADFRVAIDCVNSVGGIAIPAILRALGVKHITELNCTPDGHFPHNPEPLPENLTQISDMMRDSKADVGFVVDPDVDRLAIVLEDGRMFGEEYTLVACADYVLSHTPGTTVSNLSSSRALKDVTERHGCKYSSSKVGEVNVTTEMERVGAVIGGEGNGGVIYPASHYGRDALVGIALFLSHLAHKKCKASELRAEYPDYAMAKKKMQLTQDMDIDTIFVALKGIYKMYDVDDRDGVKINFPQGWVLLRKSNTEPIVRIYSEAPTMEQADKFADAIIAEIKRLSGK